MPGLVRDARILPRELWGVPEGRQYTYLDNLIGGRPPGYTWHHSQVSGRMELIHQGCTECMVIKVAVRQANGHMDRENKRVTQ